MKETQETEDTEEMKETQETQETEDTEETVGAEVARVIRNKMRAGCGRVYQEVVNLGRHRQRPPSVRRELARRRRKCDLGGRSLGKCARLKFGESGHKCGNRLRAPKSSAAGEEILGGFGCCAERAGYLGGSTPFPHQARAAAV